ncbi:MAG: hypothetical protein JJT89_09040 [Nitriliruptoraceae bacterium]|nr:hypothetical protein [Nitriliruptoraceae bacterium]
MGHRSGFADLVAAHHDGRGARASIERLSRAGVDGGCIVLIGPVEVVTAGRYADRQTDRGSSLALGARLLRGALYGTVPGAVFGALLLAWSSSLDPATLAAGAAGGAFLFGAVGALTGLLTVPSMAASWERTFSPLVPGGVAVGVRVDDERTDRRARRVLRAGPAFRVDEVPDLDDIPEGPWEP